MTTFHDILGTDNQTPTADIKRRYKLLSSRCHPDKDGTKALMQLIAQAYDKVMHGKGAEEAVKTVIVKKAVPNEALVQQYRQLEAQYKLLKIDNDTLNQQLETALKNLQKATAANTAAATSAMQTTSMDNSDEVRQKQDMEREIIALRRENRRLQMQIDNASRREQAQATRTSSAGQTASARSLEADNAPAGAISPTILKQIRGLGRQGMIVKSLFALLIVLILIWGLTSGGNQLRALWASLTANESVTAPDMATVLHTHPDDLAAQHAPKVQAPQVVAPVAKAEAPRIRLRDESGIWALSQFENSPEPYISVRSDKGSYIVKTCTGDFQYYKNMSVRSGRLAANLMFDRMDRHFEVYNIPYGNGSFVVNWTDSKSLLINNEYFPNLAFEMAYSDLQQRCM
ncbi:hypothetical protein ACFFLZ_13750 [Photobacterium aphoticum]|uniref:J domain-containing protein n=2 Tax=Photobacterium aphoticum TaxID=754436 RepID=A0A0J1GKW7_9GAMM|nr:hypothetical protein [Photobacterium aphoticum]KLV00395.1 hypothetical protein ABT58_12025 [Photobacterium aphoticum]PSU59735.1 hypothetical protein C9I90_01850 [Photobacterium aphoticum]GHA42801.1 hypothetical protein GCM10007086_15540 [Photobacterium aphoticum]